jgi:hypothetical protein
MAWQRRMGGIAGPLSASGEASNEEPIQVEMYISGAWVDITSYVMVRDENGNVAITRGRRDEGSTSEQATCTMLLNNRDGRWSPRYPAGVYYGLIGRNTPIRVSVPNGLGGKSYRFQGEVSLWPQGWDPTGTDVYTEIQANGILRRLSQGPIPPYSLVRTAIGTYPSANLRAYWPCEDAEDATTLASTLTTGSAMTWTGSPTLAGYDGFPSSDPVILTSGTVLTGGVPRYDDPTATQVRFFCTIPSDGLVNGTVVCQVQQLDYGGWQMLDVYYGNLGGTGHGLNLHWMQIDGTDIGADLENTVDVRGKRLYISIELQENGTAVDRALRIYDIDAQISYDVTDSMPAQHLTRVTQVRFGPASTSAASPHGTTGLSDCAIGHVTVEDTITPNTILGVRLNPIGEAAGNRVQRVCSDNNIAFESVGALSDTVLMGNQPKSKMLDVLQEAELADGGMLYESMPNLGLGYRTRASLQNQDAQLTLSYTGFNLSEIPTPVEDDRYIQNKITVTIGAISQTYSLTVGNLSTAQPPAGVGEYGDEVTLNLQDTGEALSQAAWRVHMGTVDEPRYPEISVNLAHSSFTTNPALKQAVLGLRQGDRIVVQNLPFWLPPGDIDQIILGFDETITHFEHRITFVCAPASPYRVGVLDGSLSRIDTDGSALLSDMTSNATTAYVIPTDDSYALWTTDTAEVPWDIRVGGEVMTVTAVSPYITDAFGRTVANGWGSADSGQAWTTTGGLASDYSVGSGIGVTTHPTANTSHLALIAGPRASQEVYVDVAVSATATGDSMYGGPILRAIDSNNLYMARLEFTTTNTLILTIRKRINSNETLLGTYTPSDTYAANGFYRIHFKISGTTLRASVWDATTPNQNMWHLTTTDTAAVYPFLASDPQSVGVRALTGASNTNVSPQIQFDNFKLVDTQTFTVTRSVNSITKAQTAGTDVRLAYPTIVSL